MLGTRLLTLTSACGLLLSFSAFSASPDVPAALASQVQFSATQHAGVFTIKCSRRSMASAPTTSWTAECNKLGRAAIDQAVGKKLIAPVKGVAFGEASEFPGDYSPDPHISNIVLSRDFPLIANPI